MRRANRVQFTWGYALGTLITFLLCQMLDLKSMLPCGPIKRIRLGRDGSEDEVSGGGGGVSHRSSMVQKSCESCRKHLYHGDDSSVADDLYEKVRILCWVMTSPDNLHKKAEHVRDTWGHRCNVLLFASDNFDPGFPTINISVASGLDHLFDKTIAAFQHIYQNHMGDADWFLKADDDTYVIMENLRYFLSEQDAERPVFYGDHYMTGTRIGFMSGGAGYVISKEALRIFGEADKSVCMVDVYAEDIGFADCMRKFGVSPGDSRDFLGRSRFHCQDPNTIIHGLGPEWMYKYRKHSGSKGAKSMSEFAISFHYVTPEMMHTMDYLIYKLKPYGHLGGLRKMNRWKRNSHQGY